MNSILKFLPIGNYKCISTNPVTEGTATVKYINDTRADGLLFKFSGFKLDKNGNKIPESTKVKYLADGTIHNNNVQSGKWHVEDDRLILFSSSVDHPARKHIIERVGNIITNVSMGDNEYESTEVFIVGGSKSKTAHRKTRRSGGPKV